MGKIILLLIVFMTVMASCNSDSGKLIKSVQLEAKKRPLKHNIVFKWIGEDKTIPKDGSVIRIMGTKGDTIYLGRVIY